MAQPNEDGTVYFELEPSVTRRRENSSALNRHETDNEAVSIVDGYGCNGNDDIVTSVTPAGEEPPKPNR